LVFSKSGLVFLPLALVAVSLLTSIIATFFVRLGKSKNPMSAFYKGLMVALVLAALCFWPVIQWFGGSLGLYFSSLVGLFVAGLMFLITDYYTSKKYRPVREIVEASKTGHATNIIAGLAQGMEATSLPIVLISFGLLLSYWFGGIFGVAIATVSMLSLTGLVIAVDSYGPITDNAGGIAQMAGLSEEVRETTDLLDAAGNTTKAVTKGYAIASAGLAALVLFSSYTQEMAKAGKEIVFYLNDPKILAGLFLGALLPYLFSSLAMRAVGKAGGEMVKEVRRQFREIEGIMEGRGRPNYGRCVEIVTSASIRAMVFPALIPVLGPILVGFLLGPEALGGLLIGSIITGLFVAISMTSGGAAWDNAKKYIEEGHLGGKGSFAHRAAVTGDTVGDPYKDTAGPAINPMIKVINVVALLLVKFLI
jgi:K(+)-stimulated pyrophosphate-energized sodium pump